MAARVAGAGNIIAVEINPARRALAAELGATAVVAPDSDSGLVEHLRSLNNGRGCHYAIDTTGNPAVLRLAFDACDVTVCTNVGAERGDARPSAR